MLFEFFETIVRLRLERDKWKDVFVRIFRGQFEICSFRLGIFWPQSAPHSTDTALHTLISIYCGFKHNWALLSHIILVQIAICILFILDFHLWPVCKTYIGPSSRDQNWNNWLKQLNFFRPQQTTYWCCFLCPFHHLPGSSHAKKEALCSVLLYVVLKQVTVLLLQHLPLMLTHISQRLKPRVLLSSLLHLLLHLLPSDSVLNSSSLLKILLPLLPNLTKVSLPSLLLLISLPTSISLSNNIYDDSGLDSFVDSILVHVLCPLSVSSIFLPFTLSPHKPLLSVPKT